MSNDAERRRKTIKTALFLFAIVTAIFVGVLFKNWK
jgi:hypothetical protein